MSQCGEVVALSLDVFLDGLLVYVFFHLPQVCPYFVTRGLKEEAQIVFCPYNYLLDPMVTNQV